jgi:DNA (cytosine-5)-methyltransferase 1
MPVRDFAVIDLFCGAGGLTRGLLDSGLKVVAGIDIDEDCRYPFEHNNGKAKFVNLDLGIATSQEVAALFPAHSRKVLVGCAPCQPFSTYSRRYAKKARPEKWEMLQSFSRLVTAIRPEIVSMENVPQLMAHASYRTFEKAIKDAGYHVATPCISYGPSYGLAQERSRLLFFASLLGPISIIEPTHSPEQYRTVSDAIGHLEPLKAGGISKRDRLHKSCTLSDKNLQRIEVSKPGLTWRDWPKRLVARCHSKITGETYPSVYGRMEWDKPSPTITTQFYGFGNGRFGHPDQNRAISLREGAILQDFPDDYEFVAPGKAVHFRSIGRMIGNAVPVGLGRVVGMTIKQHIANH